MNHKLKIFLVFIVICIIYTLFNYHPAIFASFDEEKYVDGEVFLPVNGTFDFRKFTLNCTGSKNFTTIIDKSGFAQFLDDGGNFTINVFEWDKMIRSRRENLNSRFQLELEKPYHMSEGIRIIEIEFLDDTFYGAFLEDEQTNTLIYIATPSENETIEMISSLKFKEE